MSAFFISRRLPDFSWNQWLICAIAATGFAFDTYELLMLPLIVKPALLELGGIQPGSPSYSLWFGLLYSLLHGSACAVAVVIVGKRRQQRQ